MHRCLEVYELAARIAEACAPYYGDFTDEGDKHKLGTVCALARTCRTLQEPALNVLWYFQFGFQNLVNCMPGDLRRTIDFSLYEARGTAEHLWYDESVSLCCIAPIQLISLMIFNFQRFVASTNVVQVDWERFDFYAKRVRRLMYNQYCGSLEWPPGVRADHIIQKFQELKGSPLLPNVQSIRWSIRTLQGVSLDSLKVLFTPTLTSLSLNYELFKKRQKLPEDVIAAIPSHCLRLQHLSLKFVPGVLNLESLPAILRKCGTLQRLTLDVIDLHGVLDPFLSELATVAKLYELGLTTSRSYIDTQNIAHPFRFPSVKVLRLHSTDALSITSVLEGCDFPSLTELSISPPRRFALRLISESISSNIAHDTLQSLTVYYRGSMSWNEVEVAACSVFDSLQPLLIFRNLRHLHIEIKHKVNISLTDADLERLAQAWPHLRHLRILPGDKRNSRGALPTYRGLVSLVRHCPHLNTLAILIAATPSLSRVERAALPTSTQRIALDFYWSEVGDPWGAASWIAKMFPHRVWVKGDSCDAQGNAGSPRMTWPKVNSIATKILGKEHAARYRAARRAVRILNRELRAAGSQVTATSSDLVGQNSQLEQK